MSLRRGTRRPTRGSRLGHGRRGRPGRIRLVIAALTAALAAAGLSACHPAARSQAGSGRQVLRWRSCPAEGLGAQCARLAVPLDYRHPGGRKITLALSLVPATAPARQRQGVLLVNPGGPGGSGLGMASFVASGLTPAVATDYDIIGFDPRGVGASTPALHCEPGFFQGVRPDYIPAGQAAELALENRAKAYAAGCQKRSGWLLQYMTSEDATRDLDSIRAALGQRQISYFAYSYGTYLGELYATLFPNRVRRMVLDSTVNPEGAWYADNIAQDYAFQGRMEAFLGWVAHHDSSYRLGSTAASVQRAWYRVRDRLITHPIAGTAGRPMIGPDEYDDTFLRGGYDDSLWPGLASAFASYDHTGATSGIISQYRRSGTQNENGFAVYNAVQCSDVNWPRDWARWDADTRRVYRTAPFQAWDNAWFNAACAFWPVKGPARPPRIGASGPLTRASGLPGILMLQGSLDAATPYAGALVAHRLLPSSRMVVVAGGGNHGQSLADPPDICVNGYLNRYLATGELPAARGAGQVNARCPAVPPPAASG